MANGQRSGDEVVPLELFFDLVFVFAVSQLSHHLLQYLSWRGATETVVLLVAVFSVWAATSWSASLPGMGRRAEAIAIVAIMPLGLFMNAAVDDAFGDRPWAFVLPFLTCRLGLGLAMLVTADNALLREHFRVQLAWIAFTSVLWCIGAAADAEDRLVWWVCAAAIDVWGSWTAHRLPWRRLQTRAVDIAPQHMIERSRLLLIIALGEAILQTGVALADAQPGLVTAASGALALLCVALLWAIYFAGSDLLVEERASTTDDPLGLARIASNSQVLNLASLIAIAVAAELAISHPREPGDAALSLLLVGGVWLFIATQVWYLRKLTGGYSTARLLTLAALPVAGAVSLGTPGWVILALTAATLGALSLTIVTPRLRTTTTHQDPVGRITGGNSRSTA